MNKKNVLCFGDSNTWGYAGHSTEGEQVQRYGCAIRWPGVMQGELGLSWNVIEEGLCGRTTAFDDPTCEGRNGLEALRDILSQLPSLEAVVISLGVNDLKGFVCGDTKKSAEALGRILSFLEGASPAARILVILPPYITSDIFSAPFAAEFGRPSIIEDSRQLNRDFAAIAEAHNAASLDGAKYASAGTDGLHYDAQSHIRLGKIATQAVRTLCEE